jgi:hypothetical protein
MQAELAIFEALKHRIATGAQLAGLNLTLDNGEAEVRILEALPNPSVFHPKQVFSVLMNADELGDEVRDALPPWAAAAQLDVREDSAGERILTARLAVPSVAFQTFDIAGLSAALDGAQVSLAPRGANIGRTMVTVTDITNGEPLYASANDVLWGYRSRWYSPLVEAYSDQSLERAGNASPESATSALPIPPP